MWGKRGRPYTGSEDRLCLKAYNYYLNFLTLVGYANVNLDFGFCNKLYIFLGETWVVRLWLLVSLI